MTITRNGPGRANVRGTGNRQAGFTILWRSEVADYRDRSLAYFRAIEGGTVGMFAEISSAGDILIDEARGSVEKAQRSARVRPKFFVTER